MSHEGTHGAPCLLLIAGRHFVAGLHGNLPEDFLPVEDAGDTPQGAFKEQSAANLDRLVFAFQKMFN